MSIKISQLPNLTVAQLITTGTEASWPLVANTGATNETYRTTVANIKTYVETGNFNVTGGITASTASTFYGQLTVVGNIIGNITQGTTSTVTSVGSLVNIQTDGNLSYPLNNGFDVGTRMFYNKGTGDTAALVWKNSTQYLTYYGSGAGNANTTLSPSAVLGTLQLGQILIANNTPSFANSTGALQVSGGISTGGNVFVGEHVYAAGDVTAVDNGIFGNIRSNATISAATTLTAAGAATAQSLSSNSYVTVHTTLVTGGNITANGLSVNASTTIGSTLGVTGAVAIGGRITAIGGLQNTPIGNTTATTATFTTVRTGSVIPTTANTFTLGNSSTWYSAVYATAVQSYYADLAEKYIADRDYEPGTVVVFGGPEEITVTTKLEDRRVAGVISTDPAYLMNMSSAGLPVALRGKVPVKIIGQVSKGDLLVTSDLPGYGISVGFRSDYSPNAVFAKSLVDDNTHEARVIWAVIL